MTTIKRENIKYGTILKVRLTDDDEIDTVMLVDNSSAGDGYSCLVLDLRTKEIFIEYEDLDDFVEYCDIVELVGDFNDMFVFPI